MALSKRALAAAKRHVNTSKHRKGKYDWIAAAIKAGQGTPESPIEVSVSPQAKSPTTQGSSIYATLRDRFGIGIKFTAITADAVEALVASKDWTKEQGREYQHGVILIENNPQSKAESRGKK